jgi:hypothetical protein
VEWKVRAAFLISTVTPRSGVPAESVTVPVISPQRTWARAEQTGRSRKATSQHISLELPAKGTPAKKRCQSSGHKHLAPRLKARDLDNRPPQ